MLAVSMLTSLQYFQLKRWSQAQRSGFVDKNVGAYTSYVDSRIAVPCRWLTGCRFGLVATVLEMIPIANMFFTYTNTGKLD